RPENTFILFRRKCCEDSERALSSSSSSAPSSRKTQRQVDTAKTISKEWKEIFPEECSKWEALAEKKKREQDSLH
ncbi:hypothetical protein B0H14DRAFT_2311430, partial [Mycena olivaceomarginata]